MAYEAKINPANREVVAMLEEKLSKAQGIYFTDFKGLTVAEMNRLRSSFFKVGNMDYIVSKNTLMRIALGQAGLTDMEAEFDETLVGPTGLVIGYDDPIGPIKTLSDFAKTANGRPEFKGGIVDGEFVNVEAIQQLKDIPPVEQLYAEIVGSISSPLQGFVNLVNEVLRTFVAVIDAIIEQKKAAGEE